MKKSIFLLAAALVGFTACTNEEVTEIADSRAISFSTFVGNPTKAVNDLNESNAFTQFTLYGAYTLNAETSTVFDAATATYSSNQWSYPTEYWVNGGAYKFAAYSNGNTTATASFDETNGYLSISDYEVSTYDLIVATATATGKATNNSAVTLNFGHLLSKVNFKFISEFADNLTLTITSIKLNQIVNKGSYTTQTSEWTLVNETKADKSYADVTASTTGVESEECYVLPQELASANYTVSFIATLTDEVGTQLATANFNPALPTTTNWVAANAYTYSISLNQENFDDQLQPIVLTPSVNGWTDNDGTVTIQ